MVETDKEAWQDISSSMEGNGEGARTLCENCVLYGYLKQSLSDAWTTAKRFSKDKLSHMLGYKTVLRRSNEVGIMNVAKKEEI